jgi:hypothetical protein
MVDFVIPLHKRNFVIRTVIEGIIYLYSPMNIYIIISNIYIDDLKKDINDWNISVINIFFIEEETFFILNYNLAIDDIKKYYYYLDEKSREFGWWYQQIIKLGSVYQIKNLSDPFIVWDGDLIPIIKWNIENPYKFAILQEKAKNIFNILEYKKSIYYLLNLEAVEPEKGTFVPHHFIMYHDVVKSMLKYIMVDKNVESWIELIIGLSKVYYRFSEYKCLATFMNKFYPNLLLYHDFDKYGKYGIRYRNNKDIIEIIKEKCKITNSGLEYLEILNFIKYYYKYNVSYLQIEHIE